MKVLPVYVWWLVLIISTVECNNTNGNDGENNTLNFEIQKVESEIGVFSNLARHLNIFKLKEKLNHLENLKKLLIEHLTTFINNKLSIFHPTRPTEPPTTEPPTTEPPTKEPPTTEPPTTEPPTTEPTTTITIISTTRDDGDLTEMPTTTLFPNNTNPVPCYQENDLAVVIDASGSVGSANYQIALEFGARLMSTWKLYEKNGVAAAVYASRVHSIFTFDEGTQLDENEVRIKILGAPYLASTTASHLALDWALAEHISTNSAVQKNLVFLTDGFSDNPRLTLDAAQRLELENIRVFSIGVGLSTNHAELLQIAANKSEHVFTRSTFMDLLDILKPVSEIICV